MFQQDTKVFLVLDVVIKGLRLCFAILVSMFHVLTSLFNVLLWDGCPSSRWMVYLYHRVLPLIDILLSSLVSECYDHYHQFAVINFKQLRLEGNCPENYIITI